MAPGDCPSPYWCQVCKVGHDGQKPTQRTLSPSLQLFKDHTLYDTF